MLQIVNYIYYNNMRRPPQFCRNTAREHATEEDAKKLLSTVQTAVQAPKMKIKFKIK